MSCKRRSPRFAWAWLALVLSSFAAAAEICQPKLSAGDVARIEAVHQAYSQALVAQR
jgi:hypothetical protein